MTQPDWAYVKKTTLWPYEDLLQKLDAVLRYPVIRQVYNHSMPQAADFARRLFPDKDLKAGEFPAEIIAAFERLRTAGIRNWADLLDRIATQNSVRPSLSRSPGFEQLSGCSTPAALPLHPTRELRDPENRQEMDAYIILKQQKMCSLIVEKASTAECAALLNKPASP
jgi:hypothetical protein